MSGRRKTNRSRVRSAVEASARLAFTVESRKAKALWEALATESKHAPGRFARCQVTLARNAVVVSLVSHDLSQLRASVNSFFRLAQAALGALDANSAPR